MKNFRVEFLACAACGLAAAAALAQPNSPSGWQRLAESGAEMVLVPDPKPPVPDRQAANSLRLTVKQMKTRFGIVCANIGKTKLSAGQRYGLSSNPDFQPPKSHPSCKQK